MTEPAPEPESKQQPKGNRRGHSSNFFNRYMTYAQRSTALRKKKKQVKSDKLQVTASADGEAPLFDMWQKVRGNVRAARQGKHLDAVKFGLTLVLPKKDKEMDMDVILTNPALVAIQAPALVHTHAKDTGALLGMAVTCGLSALHAFFACHAAMAIQPRSFLCFTEGGLNLQQFRHDQKSFVDGILPSTHFEQYWHARDEIYHIDPQVIAKYLSVRSGTSTGNEGVTAQRKRWSHAVIAATERMLLIDPRDEHDKPIMLTPLQIIRHADADTVRLGAWTDQQWQTFGDSRRVPVSVVSVPMREFATEIFHKIPKDRTSRVQITKTRTHLNFEIERGNTRIPLTYELFEPQTQTAKTESDIKQVKEEKDETQMILRYVVSARELMLASNMSLICQRLLIKFPPMPTEADPVKAPLVFAAEMEPRGTWNQETFFEMYVAQE